MRPLLQVIGLLDQPFMRNWQGGPAVSRGTLATMSFNRANISLNRHVRRLLQLYIGLWVYGFGAALQVRSGLGLDPWDVFHQGTARHIGLAIGTVLIIVGALVLLLWIPLRQRPGLGTVSNVVLIGVSLNVSLQLVPVVHGLLWRVIVLSTGIVLGGVATGMYIGARYGPGPRDGLMTGLARRTGRSIRLVRTAIELTVLGAGWLLGGTVGVGTLAYALAIGPLAQIFLPLFDVARPRRAAERATARPGVSPPLQPQAVPSN